MIIVDLESFASITVCSKALRYFFKKGYQEHLT